MKKLIFWLQCLYYRHILGYKHIYYVGEYKRPFLSFGTNGDKIEGNVKRIELLNHFIQCKFFYKRNLKSGKVNKIYRDNLIFKKQKKKYEK